MRRNETPKPISIKFGVVVDIPDDIVTCTHFDDHRLRGFWVAGGQVSPFPIDFHRRPYNTLALSCECVISCISYSVTFGRIAVGLFDCNQCNRNWEMQITTCNS